MADKKNIGNQKYNEDNSQLKTKLRKELIDFYRSKHSSFHLSPILDNEEDTPLLEFYVMPEISVITFERAFGGGREKKTQIPDLRGIFYKDNILFNEVYLTADAGLGKTSFCKRLALTWCHAKESNTEHAKDPNSGCAKDLTQEHAKLAISKDTKYLRKEEIKTMAEFDFLFLVFLRDSFEDCHIIDMVLNQIVTELELENISRQDVENILSNEKCLVILDGLDEWSHPKNSCKRYYKVIPHRKAKQCTILTTTRPWKLSDIKTSLIEQKLVVSGLPEESANSLKERVISHLCAGKEVKKRVEEFNSSVKEKKVSNPEKIPIMLMYFLCLFCENRQLGRSLCMLYSNITDMLFCRTVKIHTEIPQLSKISQSEIPKCFQENEFCKQFYTLLTVLGKLAFHTLLVETRQENTLVFDRSVVDQFLNEVSLNFCLRTGILTQSKVRGKLLKQETKVSFAHKTVQEFFAAFNSITDPVQFQEIVLSKCKCVQDILKMSKVLIFVSGINEKLPSLILSKVINIVNNDKITQEYRNTLDDSSSLCHQQLKEFQNLCVSCSREFSWELQHNFSLHDVFINESCQEEQYRENLKTLMTRNTQDIRSLLIDMSDMLRTPYTTTQKVIDYFLLHDLVNIENIRYKGEYYDILPLLNSSVKCLSIVCYSSWSQLLFEKVNGLQKLEAIHLSMFKISHSELNSLLDYISQRDCMKEIRLLCLYCTDHRMRSCTGFSLDLSRNSTLRKLTLDSVPLTQVIVNMSSLEHCWLQHLRNPDFVLKFLNNKDCKLRTFYCKEIISTVAIDAVLDSLSLLHHVTEVRLWSINLGRRSLTFFPRENIARLLLWWVKIDASTFRELVDFVHKLSQTVTVHMFACTISPEDECESEKEKIKTLQRDFRILRDEKYKFVFETIKD